MLRRLRSLGRLTCRFCRRRRLRHGFLIDFLKVLDKAQAAHYLNRLLAVIVRAEMHHKAILSDRFRQRRIVFQVFRFIGKLLHALVFYIADRHKSAQVFHPTAFIQKHTQRIPVVGIRLAGLRRRCGLRRLCLCLCFSCLSVNFVDERINCI